MNRIIFEEQQIVHAFGIDQGRIRLNQRQTEHLIGVCRAQVGETFKVGRLNGRLGLGEIVRLNHQQAELDFTLTDEPIPSTGIVVVLALPRPKMFKRIVQMLSTLRVNELVLINSYRVEKSFWLSPLLEPDAIHQQLLLGLEQAGVTLMPKVKMAPRFKPFVEDELPAMLLNRQGFVAHPTDSAIVCPVNINAPLLLAIGPEGGFIPYEIELLQHAGLKAISLGPSILRVETAVAVALGRIISPASY